jgi:hypothetical protein
LLSSAETPAVSQRRVPAARVRGETKAVAAFEEGDDDRGTWAWGVRCDLERVGTATRSGTRSLVSTFALLLAGARGWRIGRDAVGIVAVVACSSLDDRTASFSSSAFSSSASVSFALGIMTMAGPVVSTVGATLLASSDPAVATWSNDSRGGRAVVAFETEWKGRSMLTEGRPGLEGEPPRTLEVWWMLVRVSLARDLRRNQSITRLAALLDAGRDCISESMVTTEGELFWSCEGRGWIPWRPTTGVVREACLCGEAVAGGPVDSGVDSRLLLDRSCSVVRRDFLLSIDFLESIVELYEY